MIGPSAPVIPTDRLVRLRCLIPHPQESIGYRSLGTPAFAGVTTIRLVSPPSSEAVEKWSDKGAGPLVLSPVTDEICAGRLCRGRGRRSPNKLRRDRDSTADGRFSAAS